MMIKRILTVLVTVAAGTAGTSLALAQVYPQPPGSVYSRDPNYPPGGYPADYRDAREAPEFDALEDDQAPRGSVALSPPGPILSPDDPRYGRPAGAPPVYTDRAVPQGPILSPDDPRYGRPDGPTVIYADRPPGAPPQQTYSDRGSPGVLSPPEAIGPRGSFTGAIPHPPLGADGKPMVLSALPPDEQPE